MTTPRIYCKVCGYMDNYNNLPDNICKDCMTFNKDVNPRWIKPSEKVWSMIENDFYKNRLPQKIICQLYGISRNSLYLHLKNNPKKIIIEDTKEKPFWIRFKELFQ